MRKIKRKDIIKTDRPKVTYFRFLPNEPLLEHNLEQSPCRPIIATDKIETMGKIFYHCKIHPGVWNIDLKGIEHHCKYQEPDIHKDEILKLLSINKVN